MIKIEEKELLDAIRISIGSFGLWSPELEEDLLKEINSKALSQVVVVGRSEQLVCPHCKGKGEYIDTHPERYGLKTCECQAN